MKHSRYRRIENALPALAWLGLGLGLALGSPGCVSLVQGHCANGTRDLQCGEGMFCSQCTLENDGCVSEMPADASCYVGGGGGAETDLPTSSSGPGASETGEVLTDGPSTDTDPDGGSTSSDGGSESGSSDGGIPTCADMGNTCMPAAPEGFDGPVVVVSEDASGVLTTCGGAWDTEATEAFTGLVAPAANCPCSCGNLMNAVCSGGSVRRYSASNACVGSSVTQGISAGCTDIAGSGWTVPSSVSFYFEAPTVTAGSCMAQFSVEVLPVEFATRHLACGGTFPQLDCAEGELCLAPAEGDFSPQWCVWATGDVACPADSMYSDRTIYYRDSVDERGCDTCTCSLPTAPCTGTTATLANATDCNAGAGATQTLTANTCVPGNNSGQTAQGISHNVGTPPAGGCTPNTPAPTGTAQPSDPITVCCTP